MTRRYSLKFSKENQTFWRAVGLLNKIYGLVQAERCWFNNVRYDRTTIGFEQSEVDPCVFRKFHEGEVEILVVVHVDDILARAKYQATIEWFAAELGGKFEVNSTVEKFGVENPSRTPASSRVGILSKRASRKLRRRKEYMLKFLYPEAAGALMWTATIIQSDITCAVRAVARFWKPWTGA